MLSQHLRNYVFSSRKTGKWRTWLVENKGKDVLLTSVSK